MISENFVFLGVLLGLIGSTGYTIDVLRGRALPNRVSWLLWAVAPLIAFWAEIQKGVGLVSLMTFAVGFGPLMVFTASFFGKKSAWKIGKFDIVCGALSVVGLILWGITREGNMAIFFSLLADAFAGIPTVIKSYREPETESYLAYLMSAISALITLFAIQEWYFAHYAFPAYIFAICLLLFVLIRFKIGKRLRAIR